MPELHETRIGQQFFQNFNELVKGITRIADHLNEKNDDSVTAKPNFISHNEVANIIDRLESLAIGGNRITAMVCDDAIGLIRKLTV